MKKFCILLCLLLCMTAFSGCENVMAQVETIASQIDVEAVITGIVENVDWEELTNYAQQGYDALVEHFPALKGDNIKAYLKNNGLELLNRYVESSNAGMQENARKLGQILIILNPELTDEVQSVIGG